MQSASWETLGWKKHQLETTKVHLVKAIVFSVVMYGCESWTIKKAERRRIDAFELWRWRRILRFPWTARKSNQSILKKISWMFIGRTDVAAETPIRCPPDEKSWLIGKDPDVGKDWGQEKRMTKDEMIGWHHWLNGHGFGWAPGVGDGHGGLACCNSWCCSVGHDQVIELNWSSFTVLTGIINFNSISIIESTVSHTGYYKLV